MVTDAEERAALAVVRSLGSAGHRVVCCSSRPPAIAAHSRHCSRHYEVPAAAEFPDRFTSAVTKIVADEGVDVLLPLTDVSMDLLLSERDGMEDARIPFASRDVYRAISDKAKVVEKARELGMKVPAGGIVTGSDAALPDELETLTYPIVVKPSRSVVRTNATYRKLEVTVASGASHLHEILDGIPEDGFPVLLQERLRGPGIGVFLLRWNGAVRAVFGHRRLREKPPWGGVSVYRESVNVPPLLRRHSERLLEAFGYEGVAMVEYKRSNADGHRYLMEVNARFWGSLQLAIDAGVDFPKLLLALALGAEPQAPAGYATGVRSRWWLGDVDHLLARLRGAPGAERTEDTVGRARAMAEFLKIWRPGDRSEVFRLRDPLPFVVELREWLRATTRGVARRLPTT